MRRLLWIIIVLAVCSALWIFYALRAVDSQDTDRQAITIEEGWSTKRIARELDDEHLIRSPFAFSLAAKFLGDDGKLQAGTFILEKSFDIPQILQILRSGKSEEMSITVPEGFTVKDIDALLARKGLTATGEVIRCASECDFVTFDFLPSSKGLAERGGKLEGYLFPDTYFVSTTDFVPKFFLERMLGAFRKNIIEDHATDLAASKRSLHEIVTMGSLIEEESRAGDERKTVSGILWKRFDEGRGLGVDATVRYILDKPQASITVSDLATSSPYNTRKFRGLPPGPIANPGLESLLAAMLPKESPYWYYLHDDDGLIHYAVTNDEHNQNRTKYLGAGSG